MTSYEIFDLFCPDLTQKINSDNVVLTEKYVVGKQRIRMHILKNQVEGIDPAEVLDFSNQLQNKYAYQPNWNCFYFSFYQLQDQNITTFQFFA